MEAPSSRNAERRACPHWDNDAASGGNAMGYWWIKVSATDAAIANPVRHGVIGVNTVFAGSHPWPWKTGIVNDVAQKRVRSPLA